MKVIFMDAIVAPQVPLRLIPEVLDTVDVILLMSKQFWMVDPIVVKFGNVQHIIGPKAVGEDDWMGPDLVSYDR